MKTCLLLFALLTSAAQAADSYNVVWDSPSTDAHGSMPLGNGGIGLNAWAQADGTIHLLISKTDAWDDNSRLVKVGEVVVRFDPNPFAGKFKQELDLPTGSILFQDNIRLWVDANHPVIHLTTDLPATAAVALWRTNCQEIAKLQNSDIMTKAPKDATVPYASVVAFDGAMKQAGRANWSGTTVRATASSIAARITLRLSLKPTVSSSISAG